MASASSQARRIIRRPPNTSGDSHATPGTTSLFAGFNTAGRRALPHEECYLHGEGEEVEEENPHPETRVVKVRNQGVKGQADSQDDRHPHPRSAEHAEQLLLGGA